MVEIVEGFYRSTEARRTRASSLLPRLKEPTMAKSILVSLAILTLGTSAALAATETAKTHHRHAAKPPAAAAPVAAAPAPVAAAPAAPVASAFPSFLGVSAADHDLYIKNQQDSGLASGR
jgi:hypothetical protein